MKKTKSGFTLIEVILVVAIATLLFMSVVMGIGSRIATSRYEVASSEIADYLRDMYTVALNTENSRGEFQGAREYCTIYGATELADDSGVEKTGKKIFTDTAKQNSSDIKETDIDPGRTNCAIYGKAIYFGARDGKAHVFDVIGDIVKNNLEKIDGKETTELKLIEDKPILDQLKYVRADIFAATPDISSNSNLSMINSAVDCKLSPAGSHTTYEPNWGTLFKTANSESEPNKDFVGMVMIVRAPATGNVHTFFYEAPNESANWDDFLSVEKSDEGWIDVFDDSSVNSIGCGDFSSTSGVYPEYVEKYSPVQLIEDQEKRALSDLEKETVPENTGFCIGSDDFYVSISNVKKYIKFVPGGQNASAVKLIESEEDNPCRK